MDTGLQPEAQPPVETRRCLPNTIESYMQYVFCARHPATHRLATCLFLLSGSIGTATLPSQTAFAQGARATANGDILVTGRRPARTTMPSIVVEKVINIIGLEGAKSNGSGRLTISENDVVFLTDKTTSTIPISAIKSVAMDHTSKPLLRGIAGTLAGFAPNGGGQVYGAIRPGAEMLSLFYEDEDNALHTALMLIPKSSKPMVEDAFERVGMRFDEPMEEHRRASPKFLKTLKATNRPVSIEGRPAVTILLPESDGVPVPTAFIAGAYEELVAQTVKSGLFGTVWREGDRRAGGGALSMTVRITDFKKGNAGVRGAIPVVGMIAGKTLITANVSLADASGKVLLDQEVEGSKRMMGESIAATKSLAQRVTGSIKKVPGFVKGPPSVTAYVPDEVASR